MNLYDDPVFLTEAAMLSALLFAGLYLSHVDFSTRRVPNPYVLGLVLAGVAGQVLMVQLEVVTAGRVLANAGTAVVIAGALLWFHFWASGDAKFFFAAVVALPPSLSARTEALSPQATPWALLLNVLACYLFVLLLLPLCRRLWGWPGELEPPGMREAGKAAVRLAGILGLTLGLAHLALGHPLPPLETIGILLIGDRLVDHWLKNRRWLLIAIPGLAALAFFFFAFGGWAAYLKLLGVAWVLEVAYLFVRRWHNHSYVQTLPVRYLHPGAIPVHRLEIAVPKGSEGLVCDGGRPLTERQVSRLRSLVAGGHQSAEDLVEVEETIPFVPVIAMAVVLTACFAGNLVPPLVRLIHWLSS